MWQRFSERARRVIFYSQEEAARLGENYVAPEHMLLGLVRDDDSVAARILDRLGVPLDRVRSEIEKQVTPGPGHRGQDMQLTPPAKRVIDLSYEEARQLSNNYIGTEHLLLGLLREGNSLAAQVLIALGASLEQARRLIYRWQQGEDAAGMEEVRAAEIDASEATFSTPLSAAPSGGALPGVEWDRLSMRARRVVLLAQEEVTRLGEVYLGSEHLLLGLTRDGDSRAARVLDRLGVPLGRIRSDIERQVTPGHAAAGQDMQLTSRAKRVIDLAYTEARQLNNDTIRTEHLLLGLIREGDGLAARILLKLGADLERTRREVIAMQEGENQPSATPLNVGSEALSMERLEHLAQPEPWVSLAQGGRRIAVGHAVAAARAVIAREGRLTDLVSAGDLTPIQARALLTLARALKASMPGERMVHRDVLAGRTLALVFEKPSLRTRVTFEVGMYQLGGFTVALQPAEIQLGQRETVADAARNLERWVDGIMARTFSHAHVVELAQHAGVPVINGLTDREHPCQALADFLTIREKKGRTEGLKLAYIGDGNNVAHSLLLLGAKLGTYVVVAHPQGYAPNAEIVRQAQEAAAATGAQIELTQEPAEAARDADIIYTDVWASMGQEAEAKERKKRFAPYQVNADLVRQAKWDAIVMHDLPAHRGEEITDDVMDGPQSVIFDQAENRLHAQKALLAVLLG
jgi:ornithine carbamoyltransferase